MQKTRKKANFRFKLDSKTASALFAAALLVLLLTDPARYIGSVRAGLMLFANNVLPSLFPFLFLTKFLTMQNAADRLVGAFKPAMRLFRCPPAGGYVFVMSMLSGYPIGAKVASDLKEQGALTSSDCRKILSFSSTSGPFFVVGTAGALMFGSAKAGWAMLLAHILSSLIAGLLFCRFSKKTPSPPAFVPPKTYSDALSQSVFDSILSILNIGGFITLFYVLLDMLAATHALVPVNNLLALAFGKLGMNPGLSEPICYGIVEITRGCAMLSQTNASLLAKSVAACFLISFGGLSINVQALGYVKKCGVGTGVYFLQKLLHCIVSIPVAFVICLLFGV